MAARCATGPKGRKITSETGSLVCSVCRSSDRLSAFGESSKSGIRFDWPIAGRSQRRLSVLVLRAYFRLTQKRGHNGSRYPPSGCSYFLPSGRILCEIIHIVIDRIPGQKY